MPFLMDVWVMQVQNPVKGGPNAGTTNSEVIKAG